MGRDKARLPFRGGDLVSAVIAAVASAAGNVTLVGHPELPSIPDRYPGGGPLGGILTALNHTAADWNLIVACDMPEVSAAFLRELLARAMRSPADVLLPRSAPSASLWAGRSAPTAVRGLSPARPAGYGRSFRPRRAPGDRGPRRSRGGALDDRGCSSFAKRYPPGGLGSISRKVIHSRTTSSSGISVRRSIDRF